LAEYSFPRSLPAPRARRTHIFRLKPASVSERAVRTIARRFKLHGDAKSGTWHRDPTKLTYSEGPREVSLYHGSGGWRFRDTARWQRDDGRSNLDVSDGAAVEIAQKHVERLGLAGRAERELGQVTRLHVGVAERATGYVEERIIDVGVAFRRIVDGVRVEGPGGKLVLYLDGNGEITGVDRLWRDIQAVHRPTGRLRSPRAALGDVEKAWSAHGAGRIEVTAVRFGYFEHGWDAAQRFLQPMYIMPLRLTSYDERFVAGSEHVVPAAVHSVETWEPPPMRTPDGPPRSSPRPGAAEAE
jgi:hypothetical protein